jgi:hypothetical protein
MFVIVPYDHYTGRPMRGIDLWCAELIRVPNVGDKVTSSGTIYEITRKSWDYTIVDKGESESPQCFLHLKRISNSRSLVATTEREVGL